MHTIFTGKSEGKAEEPVDWSFAVLELLREQGWDVKEMNERCSFLFVNNVFKLKLSFDVFL